MESLFNSNGLIFWNEREIRLRRQFEEHFAATLKTILLNTNLSWTMFQFEGPILTPRNLINPNYTNQDIWVQHVDKNDLNTLEVAWRKWMTKKSNLDVLRKYLERWTLGNYSSSPEDMLEGYMTNATNIHQQLIKNIDEEPSRIYWESVFDRWMECTQQGSLDLVLRPETTPSSYSYISHLLNSHPVTIPPFCVWQTGKSFRREQNQVTKNMRLKEFYQQEFQCVYTTDTLNDYHKVVQEPVRIMIEEMIHQPTRIVESDRLPSYSTSTVDVEAELNGNWMEICSISKRTDLQDTVTFQTKKGFVTKELEVLEIAIGLDRCVYAFEQKGDT